MDFHQLRVFVEVARQKNFSRAAENIFLSQPTISAHIKTLENEVGTP
ncbi:MAG: LysR family transcriptional regulator, partial [Firmicutes bacterium]|nr:LysR family transcriptional regulator [Bacillota bacterium]